jgi:hypothetical protein
MRRIDLDTFQRRADEVLLPHVSILLGVGRWDDRIEVVVQQDPSPNGTHSLADAAARRLAKEFKVTCSINAADPQGWRTIQFEAA